jgi:hypothetical protein
VLLLAVISIGLSLAFAVTASAHRIDEYLQAARLAIAPDRVTLEMDLTPGVDVAPLIFALINTNHDGSIASVFQLVSLNRGRSALSVNSSP